MTMEATSETVTRRGFVVEEGISGCADGCTFPRFWVLASDAYGQETFHDLTAGLTVRQHSGWEVLNGICPRCDCEIVYRRMFVVSEEAVD